MKVLGLMTGNSMDGIDCCYADINISKNLTFYYNIIDSELMTFDADTLNKIKVSINEKNYKNINSANKTLGKYLAFISKKFIKGRPLDLISMHGQTILHIDKIKTIQIGDPKYLFHSFHKPVVYDFRSKDISLGGTGAPLMPFLDWLLYKNENCDTITLNIGGISNITYIPADSERIDIIGFDTGPGMCMIDKYVQLIYDEYMDVDAIYSKNGTINSDLLEFLLLDRNNFRKPPKSLSVEYYHGEYLNNLMNEFSNISSEDFLRTLVNYTVKSIQFNIVKFVDKSKTTQLIISGGGIKHPLILKDLKTTFKSYLIKKCSLKNSTSDFKESLLMAVMGYTCYKKIFNNMISVTGAIKNDTYGVIYE